MSKVSEMTRDKWIMSTFPEWGTWLVEDIENEVVQPGNVAMWWLGCTGIWMKTPGGGNIYHSGDSHFSIYFAKHGKDYDIDVAFGSFGENPIGMQDKMTSIDVLRMAENLQCKVVIPIHWDVWTNFQADCEEIKLLYDFKKDRNEYKFHPFFWQVGGKYVYPQDKDKIYYHHRRGFEDCFEHPQNIPYRSCL